MQLNKTLEKEAESKYEQDDGPLTDEQVEQLKKTVDSFKQAGLHAETTPVQDQAKEDLEIENFFKRGRAIAQALDKTKLEDIGLQEHQSNSTNLNSSNEVDALQPILSLEEIKVVPTETEATLVGPSQSTEWEDLTPSMSAADELATDTIQSDELDTANVKKVINDVTIETATLTTETAPAMKLNLPPPPEAVPPKAKEIIQVPETIDRRKFSSLESGLTADNTSSLGNNVKAHFGITFPMAPEKGELFLRVDYLPTRLFKFNGSKWIEVDKTMTDSYVYNTEYIKFMIKEIDAGRLDPDDISSSERDQIADFLANDEQTRNTP